MSTLSRRSTRLRVAGIFCVSLLALATLIISRADHGASSTSEQLSTDIDAAGASGVTVSWISPPTQTSSRFLAYEIRFSEPVRGVTASDFSAVGAAGPCTFTVPAPTKEYSTKYSVLMSCLGIGTIAPTFTASSVSSESLDASSVSGTLTGADVSIIAGTVITVTKIGSGSGTVTSNLSGITCGLLCTGAFPPGTKLTLTAVAQPGDMFVGWSGACTGTSTCVVTLTTSQTAIAQFEQAGTLIVTKMGTGQGTVSAKTTTLNCGPVCRSSVRLGQSVTLTALPARTSVFVGWLGACSGAGACVLPVPLSDDYFVYAVFAPR